MTDGQKLKLVRSALEMSQRELAHGLGTSQGIISAVEGGKQLLSRRLLELLRDKYKLNTDWFINQRGEMFGKTVPLTSIHGDDKDEIIRLLKEQVIQLQTIIEDKSRIIRLLEDTRPTKNDSN